MTLDRHPDVVVVGARPAGAATAMLLARAGLDVLVVDRSRYGTDTLSTHALMRAGVLQLSRWGLLDRIVAAGTPPIHRTTFRYGGATIPVSIKPGSGVDALYAPRRTVLDPIVVDGAIAAGAAVRYGIAVTDVVRGGDGRVTGVRGRSTTGEPFAARAGLVIGADGMRSTIATRVQAREHRRGTAASSTIYGYWSGLEVDGYEWNFRPDAASGVIPTNDDQACVFAAASPDRVGRGGIDVFDQIVAASSPQLADRLRAATPVGPVRTFPGRPGHLRHPYGPGWALVGDAGYFKDPIGAHGLSDALRDAELLARAVVDIHDGATEAEALATYHRCRDSLSTELLEVVDIIAGHRWSDDEIGGLLLRLSAAMNDEVETLSALPAWPPRRRLRAAS